MQNNLSAQIITSFSVQSKTSKTFSDYEDAYMYYKKFNRLFPQQARMYINFLIGPSTQLFGIVA